MSSMKMKKSSAPQSSRMMDSSLDQLQFSSRLSDRSGGGGDEEDEEESESESKESNEGGSISLKSFTPDVPYINELKKKSKEDLYSTYFELRKKNKVSPAFYLDVSDYFFKQDLKVDCLRILTNILELGIENSQLYRIIAYKLEEFNSLDLSEQMFRKVLKLSPNEPQSYRDLAIVLGKKRRIIKKQLNYYIKLLLVNGHLILMKLKLLH